MSIHIKKISNFTSFCGLNNVNSDEEFKNYNVIFANNGSGKTSVTRAIELLIQKNTHISKYQTINSPVPPSIEFELSDRTLTINESAVLPTLPFRLEIYNSDFLQYNAPLSSEFGLKKLDDETIVLEGSAVGAETKELEELKKQKDEAENKQNEIGNIRDIENIDENSEIKKYRIDIEKADKSIEAVRKNITSTAIQISGIDLIIPSEKFDDILNYDYEEKKLVSLQHEFDKLNAAIKQFDSLSEIIIPSLGHESRKVDIDSLLNFDIKKEAGKVGLKVKEHILEVGEQFIKDGRKLVKNTSCPFCMQPIENDILIEYASYFNEAVENFDNLSQEIESEFTKEITKWEESKNQLLNKFEEFKPFLDNFETDKTTITDVIDLIIEQTKQLKKIILEKKGIENKEQYNKKSDEIAKEYQKIENIINLTKNILESKKAQEKILAIKKQVLRDIKIIKGKKNSFSYQKMKAESLEKIEELKVEFEELEKKIISINLQIQELQNQRRPDVQEINSYLKALNLSKYSVNKDYKITIDSSSIIENDNLRIVLSEGEKTTITFAYFLARLKLYYNKTSLKNLIIVIDDPISSLDELRVYNTSYLISKINQEIAGEVLENSNDKAQVFIFTHSHIFMTNIIRILGNHSNYFQLEREEDLLKLISKNKVAGYFDTFYLLLFKEIFEFSENSTIHEDFNKAINYGNKIRILLESFIKTNFISEFIEKTYNDQKPFAKHEEIVKRILLSNASHKFSNSYFKDSEYAINNELELKIKLDSVVKGLHMDSHGSISDFYTQYKLSIFEVQKLAKIAINVMTALNPNQVYFYIEASKK